MLQLINKTKWQTLAPASFVHDAPDMTRVVELTENERIEVLTFLSVRPVHTVVMSSFIADNGMVSELNRGKFYGYRGIHGGLEGIALIGHSTLVEARTNHAIEALAITARTSETPLHLIMSSGDDANKFWQHMTNGLTEPRLTCIEELFEVASHSRSKKRGMN